MTENHVTESSLDVDIRGSIFGGYGENPRGCSDRVKHNRRGFAFFVRLIRSKSNAVFALRELQS